MPELILTVGLPRSGKTTWAKAQGLPIVNPDAIRLALHNRRFIADAEPMVWAVARYMVAALFLAGHEQVILDATNTTKRRRAEWVDARWERTFKVFDVGRDVCLARAVDDAEIVPVIERMANQWEPLTDDEALFDYA